MDLWSYTILFVGVAVSWIGIPIVGGVVLAGAGVLAGDGRLDVWLVTVVATVAAWTGGYVGYLLGARAGDALASRPGRWERHRRRTITLGVQVYRRWGPIAVFLTPTWVSGALRMPRNSFLFWNALAAILSSLVTVFGAFAIARALLGHVSVGRVAIVLAIVAFIAAAAGIFVHRRRRRDSERAGTTASEMGCDPHVRQR